MEPSTSKAGCSVDATAQAVATKLFPPLLQWTTAKGEVLPAKDPATLESVQKRLQVTEAEAAAALQSLPECIFWPLVNIITPEGWAKCFMKPEELEAAQTQNLLQPVNATTGWKRPAAAIEE